MAYAAGRGRRRGTSGAKDVIEASARSAFAQTGYAATTIRGIASRAKVDPALVHHYFGTKEKLFIAAMRIPVNPADVVRQVLGDSDREQVGARLVSTFLEVWDNPETARPLLALLRGAMSHERSAVMLREFMVGVIIRRIVDELKTDHAELRASLVGSQLLGLATMRHILRVPPLAELPSSDIVILYGPTMQRYLTAKLA